MPDFIIDRLAVRAPSCVYDIAEIVGNEFRMAIITPANPCNDSYSVAKTFCVTAAGMLSDDGLLDMNERVADILTGCGALETFDESWRGVTVDDVMRHRAGFGSGALDIDTENCRRWNPDWLKMLFGMKLPYAPGTHYCYTDAVFYIISRVVTAKTGEPLDIFLEKRLFAPLGVREAAWSRCPLGFPVGGTGLYIRTEDMVKLGAVYMNGGVYRGVRILSESWTETVKDRYEFHKTGGGWAKGGMYGQGLYFSRDRAVAWHAFDVGGAVSELWRILEISG